jgi:hypothetical protein
MTCYIITFQTNTDASRNKVLGILQTYSSYCPIHKYCWAIMTSEKSPQITEKIRKALAPGEFVFVIRSGTEAAWFNSYGQKNDNWLKENL